MKHILITLTLIIGSIQWVEAQYVRFPEEGVIEFEKSVNMHAIIQKSLTKNNEAYITGTLDQYKKNYPQFKILRSTLRFSKNITVYTPVPDNEADPLRLALNFPASGQHNIIYTDLSTKSAVTQKRVYEEIFLVKDSSRKIHWKLTNEFREIAGYPCRRANAIIMDSIYVVAFYTDKIPSTSGPETFTGLPGMILGVALPREHVTWFAKTVTEQNVAGTVVPPSKGKLKSGKELHSILLEAFKKYGDYAPVILKAFLL